MWLNFVCFAQASAMVNSAHFLIEFLIGVLTGEHFYDRAFVNEEVTR